ncbi:Lrp/AsnC ligand binding domain-containing protein [Halobacterium salinarum]
MLLVCATVKRGMTRAFVMVSAGAGAVADICDAVTTMEGVTDARVVAGNYDVIAEVGGEDVVDHILQNVSTEIGTITGVTDTKTYITLATA